MTPSASRTRRPRTNRRRRAASELPEAWFGSAVSLLVVGSFNKTQRVAETTWQGNSWAFLQWEDSGRSASPRTISPARESGRSRTTWNVRCRRGYQKLPFPPCLPSRLSHRLPGICASALKWSVSFISLSPILRPTARCCWAGRKRTDGIAYHLFLQPC